MAKLVVDQQGRILSNGSGMLMGFDNVPPIVVLSNLPANPTVANSADIIVGGEDVVTYKYKLDNGSYSAETPVSSHISLSSLADGSHTLYVIGKDSAGNWNPEISATAYTWTVSTIVSNGLVLHLDAATYSGSGTSLTDLSGTGNSGTLVGSPSYSSSNGGSFVTDGTDDYINVANASSLNTPSGGTAEVWIKLASRPSGANLDNHIFISKGRSLLVCPNGYILNYVKDSGASSGYQLRLDAGNASSYTASIKDILLSVNVWYHIVGVWTNTYTNLYLNGVSQHYKTHSLSLNIPTDSLTICAGRPQNNSTITSFNPGAVGVARVYNRALTGAEILQNFNATKSRFGL